MWKAFFLEKLAYKQVLTVTVMVSVKTVALPDEWE